MHKLIEDKIKELKERIKQTKELNEDVELTLEIMPEAEIWLDHEVNVTFLCKSMDQMKEILRDFAKNKILLKEFKPSDTNPVWILQGRNGTIRISPRWFVETSGAKCQLVKVGEKTTVYPIYKLICDKEIVENVAEEGG
jgi:hypothetical protein